MLRYAIRFLLACACTLPAACGGGGGSAGSSPPPPAPPPPYNPCPDRGNFSWEGGYDAAAVTFPSVPLGEPAPFYDQSNLPPSFDGTILRPADTGAYPGARPAVILQHGLNGSQCSLWYMARALAGAGYVTLVYTQPDNTIPDVIGVDFDAIVSAIDFLGSPQNPYAAETDAADIGLVGHSAGSSAVSYAQNLPEAADVKAIAALDNLKHWLEGDPGAAEQGCIPPEQYPVTARVPALGFAMDAVCPFNPNNDGTDIKEAGWSWWRGNTVPATELVMRGYTHLTFVDDPQSGGSSAQLETLAYFVEAWFDRWLNGNYSADQRLLACSVDGQNTADLLSQTFLSGVFLTEAGVNTVDYASALAGRCN